MILFLILGAVPIWGRIIRGPPGENSGQVGLALPENVAPMHSKEMVEYITQVNTMILRNILTEGNLGKKLGFHYKMNLPQMVKLFSSHGFALQCHKFSFIYENSNCEVIVHSLQIRSK